MADEDQKPTKNQWDRLPRERNGAYDEFAAFLRMPKPRNLRVLSEQTGRNYRTVRDHSMRFRWAERVRAFDDQQAAEEQAAFLAERKKVVREQAKAAKGLLTLSMANLAAMLDEIKSNPGITNLPPSEVRRGIESGASLLRLVYGDPTQRIETTQTTTLDTSSLSGDEASLLLGLLGKIGALDE